MITDLLASEWIKLRSVRSTFWTLLVTVVTAVGGSAVVAVANRQSAGTGGAGGAGTAGIDPTASIYLAWLEYPVLAIGILGILSFSAEFASGLIRTTLAAVPRRNAVLAAKAAVVGAVGLVVGELLSFASFLANQAIVGGQAPTLGDPGALRAVLSAGFGLACVAVLGVALGALARHTAGAIAAFPAVVYLPLLVLSLPGPWNGRIGRFTLLPAAYQTITATPSPQLLGPAASLVVVAAWPALALVAAALSLRRDV